MKSKRILSLIISLIMLISMSTNALALTLNMNIDGDNVVQVETGTDQFFNVTFAPREWTPNAEQIHTMYMGQNYDMWRYSGGMNI